MTSFATPPRRLRLTGAILLLLAVAACASPPPTASVSLPLIPAGDARVWFYRPVDAYDSLNTPGALTPRGDARSFPRDIRMNDAIVGISPPNGASYRDVPAG